MGFPNWATHPIPNFSLSAGGLVALADLSTVAQRTAITGGSSWLDSLVLAAGLHYQQAADELVKGSADGVVNAEEYGQGGKVTQMAINNMATVNYLRKIAKPGQVVTLDVGSIPPRYRYRLKRSNSGMHATVWAEDDTPNLGWLSHLLYLISPVLTALAIVFEILIQDWWALSFLAALMLSRIMNIIIIKARTAKRPKPKEEEKPARDKRYSHDPDIGDVANKLTEYVISLGDGRSSIRLRGMSNDLQAITADVWLRGKTHIEGYFEAAAKLIVYLVAAFSGNMTQLGAIIFMALMLASAGLLALSNAHAKSFKMNGRVASPTSPEPMQKGTRGDPPYPSGRSDDSNKRTESWPGSSAASGYSGMDDWAEKGQVGHSVRDSYPFDGSVEYN